MLIGQIVDGCPPPMTKIVYKKVPYTIIQKVPYIKEVIKEVKVPVYIHKHHHDDHHDDEHGGKHGHHTIMAHKKIKFHPNDHHHHDTFGHF